METFKFTIFLSQTIHRKTLSLQVVESENYLII